MAGNNVCILIGGVTMDPEMTYTPGGTAVTTINLAVDGYAKGEKTTHYFRIKALGDQAEKVKKFFKKGTKVSVVGSLSPFSYEKDGKKQYGMDIIMDQFSFINSGGGKGSKPAPTAGSEPEYGDDEDTGPDPF